MRSEDWRKGIEHEAASVEDQAWAREARRAAWGTRWRSEAWALLSWQRLIPVIVAGLLPLSVFVLNLLPPFPGSLLHAVNTFVNLVTSGTSGWLLLLLWVGRYAWLGYMPWLPAAVSAFLSFPMLFFVVAFHYWQTPGEPTVSDLPWLILIRNTLVSFSVLWGFAWAISRLRLGHRRHLE